MSRPVFRYWGERCPECGLWVSEGGQHRCEEEERLSAAEARRVEASLGWLPSYDDQDLERASA